MCRLEVQFFNVFFFFFKQKTAYEMRISDWSSDVCSSDLLAIARLPQAISKPMSILSCIASINRQYSRARSTSAAASTVLKFGKSIDRSSVAPPSFLGRFDKVAVTLLSSASVLRTPAAGMYIAARQLATKPQDTPSTGENNA